MKNKPLIRAKNLRGLMGLTREQRDQLAARGIREAAQLACLLTSQPELVARFMGANHESTSLWASRSMHRIRVNPQDLASQIKALRHPFGALRKSSPGSPQVAVRPNSIAHKLGEQRQRHAGLPSEIDLTDSIPFIHDQGVNPSCVGHAAAAAIENSSGETLSGSYLYLKCKEVDGEPSADGTSLDAAVSVLSDSGTCLLDTWPGANAESSSLKSLDAPPESAVAEAKGFRVSEGLCGPLSSLEEIKTALAYGTNGKGRAVLAAVPVYSSWDAASRTGSVPMRLGDGDSLLGWHAILIVGFCDDADEPGGGRFLFQNSWGEGWASSSAVRAGVGTIPYAYFSENEVESWHLEPLVSVNKSMPRVAVAWAGGLATLGLIVLLGIGTLELMSSDNAHVAADTTPAVVPLAPPVATRTMAHDVITVGVSAASEPDNWETLDGEHAALDHDAAQYAKTVLRENPEIVPALAPEWQ